MAGELEKELATLEQRYYDENDLDRRDSEAANALHRLPAELLAAELQRRGWVVMEP